MVGAELSKRKRMNEKGKEMNCWLTANGIGVDGVKTMSEVLKANTTLTSLVLLCKEEEKTERKLNVMNEHQAMRSEQKVQRQ